MEAVRPLVSSASTGASRRGMGMASFAFTTPHWAKLPKDMCATASPICRPACALRLVSLDSRGPALKSQLGQAKFLSPAKAGSGAHG